MDKTIKFAEYIFDEICRDYRLARQTERLDIDLVKDQAYTTAQELIKDLPSLTLDYLQILPKIVRKTGERVSFYTLVKAYKTNDAQIEIKALKDQQSEAHKKISNNQGLMTNLEKTLRARIIQDKLGSPKDYKGQDFAEKKNNYRSQFDLDMPELSKIMDQMYSQLISQGYTGEETYQGELL